MFKTLTGVLDKRKNPTEQEIEKIPPFIFAKWLSGNPYTISAGNEFNKFYNIPIVNQYNVIKCAFSGKIKYIPYPKNTSVNALKEQEYIQEHFKINLDKAKEYIELMDKKELQEIVNMYQARDAK